MLSFFSFRRTCWLGLPVLSVLLSSGLASAVDLEATRASTLDMYSQGGAGKVYLGGALDNGNISAVILTNGTGNGTTYLGANSTQYFGVNAIQQATYDALNPETLLQNGPSGIFSQNGAANSGALAGTFGVGFLTGAQYGWDTFGGKPVDVSLSSTAVVLRETYLGDTTLKGYVNYDDDWNNWYTGYVNSLNNSNTETWATGDFLHTGVVNYDDDWNAWYNNYVATLNNTLPVQLPLGNPGQAAGPVQAGSVAAVPEPATLALLVPISLVGLYAAARRRRGL